MVVAASFGLAGALSVVVLGDESGYLTTEHQKMKLAAMESMWETEAAPADFNLLALPNEQEHKNDFAIKIPYVMGLIGTHSLTERLPGINELVARAEERVRSGIVAYEQLQRIRANPQDQSARDAFSRSWPDLGYALLVKRYAPDVSQATDAQITQAAWDTVPTVMPLFIAFRVMVFTGFYLILFFAAAFWLVSRGKLADSPRMLKLALWSLPLPWLAIELGWFVAEYGRQPWVIEGVLPTYYAASGLSVLDLAITLGVFFVLYTVLFIVGVKVMLKAIKAGPQYPSLENLSSSSRRSPPLQGEG
jgi:cytochrome d ubiquinol oxidase subunit I